MSGKGGKRRLRGSDDEDATYVPSAAQRREDARKLAETERKRAEEARHAAQRLADKEAEAAQREADRLVARTVARADAHAAWLTALAADSPRLHALGVALAQALIQDNDAAAVAFLSCLPLDERLRFAVSRRWLHLQQDPALHHTLRFGDMPLPDRVTPAVLEGLIARAGSGLRCLDVAACTAYDGMSAEHLAGSLLAAAPHGAGAQLQELTLPALRQTLAPKALCDVLEQYPGLARLTGRVEIRVQDDVARVFQLVPAAGDVKLVLHHPWSIYGASFTQRMCDALAAGQPAVTSVDLVCYDCHHRGWRGRHIQSVPISGHELAAFARVLAHNHTIKRCSLYASGFGQREDAAVAVHALCALIRSNETLTELDLRRNSRDDQQAWSSQLLAAVAERRAGAPPLQLLLYVPDADE
jgi:hypothetical protein